MNTDKLNQLHEDALKRTPGDSIIIRLLDLLIAERKPMPVIEVTLDPEAVSVTAEFGPASESNLINVQPSASGECCLSWNYYRKEAKRVGFIKPLYIDDGFQFRFSGGCTEPMQCCPWCGDSKTQPEKLSSAVKATSPVVGGVQREGKSEESRESDLASVETKATTTATAVEYTQPEQTKVECTCSMPIDAPDSDCPIHGVKVQPEKEPQDNWKCANCEKWNSFEMPHCSRCCASREDDEPAQPPQVSDAARDLEELLRLKAPLGSTWGPKHSFADLIRAEANKAITSATASLEKEVERLRKRLDSCDRATALIAQGQDNLITERDQLRARCDELEERWSKACEQRENQHNEKQDALLKLSDRGLTIFELDGKLAAKDKEIAELRKGSSQSNWDFLARELGRRDGETTMAAAARLTKERDSLRQQLVETAELGTKAATERDSLKRELEEAKVKIGGAAAMRDELNKIRNTLLKIVSLNINEETRRLIAFAGNCLNAALQSDAGRDYVHKLEFESVVSALETALNSMVSVERLNECRAIFSTASSKLLAIRKACE